MPEMTVAGAKEKKKELENKILIMLNDFEECTGLTIKEISFNTVSVEKINGEIYYNKVGVNVTSVLN